MWGNSCLLARWKSVDCVHRHMTFQDAMFICLPSYVTFLNALQHMRTFIEHVSSHQLKEHTGSFMFTTYITHCFPHAISCMPVAFFTNKHPKQGNSIAYIVQGISTLSIFT